MSRLVKIGGQPYAVGLQWRQLRMAREGMSDRELLRLAKEDFKAYTKAAKEQNVEETTRHEASYTHVALRENEYGLAASPAGLVGWPSGTASLAAVLANALKADVKERAFLGVFCLAADPSRELWWVVSLCDGEVAPGGDLACGSKAEADKAARGLRQLLPKDSLLDMRPQTSDESIAYLKGLRLVADEAPLVALEKQKIKRLDRKVALVALTVAAVLAVQYGLDAYRDRQVYQERVAQHKTLEAKKQDVQRYPYRYFEAAWLKAPDVVAAGQQCNEAILATPLAAHGWKFSSATCAPGDSLAVKWVHTTGASYRYLPDDGQLDLPKDGQLTDEAEASVNRPLDALPPRLVSGEARYLPTKGEVDAYLLDLAAKLDRPVDIDWAGPEKYAVDEKTTLMAPWVRGTVKLTGLRPAAMLSPDIYVALGHQPAVMLTSVSRTFNDFNIEVYIYAVSNKQLVQNVAY